MKCEACNDKLTFSNARCEIGVVKVRVCKDCHDEYMKRVKRKYYVKTYKGNDIYMKDGKYFPYWDCPYYFNSLEGCKKRIGVRNVGLYW